MAERGCSVILGPWHLRPGKTQAPFTPEPLQRWGERLQRFSVLLTVPLGLPKCKQSLGPTIVRPGENSEARNVISPPTPPSLVFALSLLLSSPTATSKTFSPISSSLVLLQTFYLLGVFETWTRIKGKECSSWWNSSEHWRKACAYRFMGLESASPGAGCVLQEVQAVTTFVSSSEAPNWRGIGD